MNSRRAASRIIRRTSMRSASLFIVVFMNGAAGVESHQCALARACGVDYDREWRSGRTAHVEIAGIQSFSSGVTLYALWPHMHFRGKDMTFTLRYRRQE